MGAQKFYYTLIFIVSYREQQIAEYMEEPWIKHFLTATAKHRQQKNKTSNCNRISFVFSDKGKTFFEATFAAFSDEIMG